MLGVLINLSREQLLELVCIIIEELPWDLKTRRAIRNLLHHFHKKPNEIQAPAASGSQTMTSGCFCISALQ